VVNGVTTLVSLKHTCTPSFQIISKKDKLSFISKNHIFQSEIEVNCI